jgi:hypothetical protein
MTYLTVLIFLMPGVLLLCGAVVKLFRHNSGLHRLQVEGAVMLFAGMFFRWIVLDQNFGIDRYEESSWSYWFINAEPGLFWIGLLFLLLGFFLERRPRPGLRPWPRAGQITVALSILIGSVLCYLAWRHLGLAFLGVPFPISRMFFLLGLFPFCIGYFRTSVRSASRLVPHDPDID